MGFYYHGLQFSSTFTIALVKASLSVRTAGFFGEVSVKVITGTGTRCYTLFIVFLTAYRFISVIYGLLHKSCSSDDCFSAQIFNILNLLAHWFTPNSLMLLTFHI